MTPTSDDIIHVLAENLTPLSVRRADDNDQAFMQYLYASTRDDLRLIPADAAFIESLIAMQQRMQSIGYRNAFPDAMYLVLQDGAEALGRAVIDIDSNGIRLIDISLVPDARNKGLGTAVVRALQQCADAKVLPLMLSVYRNNPHARRLYVRCGFKPGDGDDMAEQMIWRGAAAG